MTDNERIAALQQQMLEALNGSPLPLGVKALVLENLLFRVQAALLHPAPPADKEEP